MSELVVAGNVPPGGVDYGSFKFSVKRHVLAYMVERASTAVASSAGANLPVLSCFQVKVRLEPMLQLAAADMQRTVVTQTQAVLAEAGEVYLNAKRMRDVLKEAPEGDVTVAVKKNKATVTAGSASWVFKLPPSSGYPGIIEPAAVEFSKVHRESFLAALRTVRHAVCRDLGRPAYAQVSLAGPVAKDSSLPDNPVMFATASDGQQFARALLGPYPGPVGIPVAVLDDLIRMLSSSQADFIEAGETVKELVWRDGSVTLAVKNTLADFPDMDRLVLKPALENKDKLTVDKNELLLAIRRVRINSDESTSAIALTVSPGSLALQSRDKDGVTGASESVQATWESGKRLLVVNHVFLTDLLNAHPSPSCVFRLGENVGKRLAMVLLADDKAGVTGIIPQMAPALVGY